MTARLGVSFVDDLEFEFAAEHLNFERYLLLADIFITAESKLRLGYNKDNQYAHKRNAEDRRQYNETHKLSPPIL